MDSNAFAHCLSDLKDFSALRFASYSYFREAKFEALDPEDSSVLVRKSALRPEFLWDEDERIGMFSRIAGEKRLNVFGADGKPMIRHYSGVRTKEELLKKFSTWGHHWERKWDDLVQEEFSRPFNGTDFVRGHRYREVKPQLDPLEERVPSLPSITRSEHLKNLRRFPNVIIVSQKETFKKQLEHDFAGIR